MGNQRTDHRIAHREPHHIAGNRDLGAAQHEADRPGNGPQDADERHQRHHRIEQAEGQGQRAIGKRAQIVRQPLVGVVRGVRLFDAVVSLVAEPVVHEAVGHPGTPAHLQHHGVVLPGNGRHDKEAGDPGKADQQRLEGGVVMLLQRVVEHAVPLVEQHVDVDDAEVERDHEGQQPQPGLAVLGFPVRLDQVPRLGHPQAALDLEGTGRHGRAWNSNGSRCGHGTFRAGGPGLIHRPALVGMKTTDVRRRRCLAGSGNSKKPTVTPARHGHWHALRQPASSSFARAARNAGRRCTRPARRATSGSRCAAAQTASGKCVSQR